MSPGETGRMIDLIASLPRTFSILMIEHDMKVVFSVADRITVLYYGEVLATGTPADIQANARVREVYLGRRTDARSRERATPITATATSCTASRSP